MNVHFETPTDMWMSVAIIAVTMICVFLAVRFWEARDAIANFGRVVRETWRRIRTDDYSEYEIRKEIAYQNRRGNKVAERHWIEMLERKFPENKEEK